MTLDLFTFPPIAATLDAAYGALMALAGLLEPFAGAAAAATAIILVTLMVRAALIPTGVAQAKAEQVRARLAPKLRALQERYKRDPERVQRETMKLYADENASPFAGCVPVLIQAPVVGVIYALFLHTAIAGHPNSLLAEELFGVPLGTSFVGAVAQGALDPATAAVIGTVVALIAVVAEITRRALRPAVTTGTDAGPLGPVTAQRAVGLLQFMTAAVALFVPLAAGLYLLVTVAWTLVQRLVLRRRFPLPTA